MSGRFSGFLLQGQSADHSHFSVASEYCSNCTQKIFRLNAVDPVLLVEWLLKGLANCAKIHPTISFNHGRLVLQVERQGKSLDFRTPPDDPDISRYLEVLRHLAYRSSAPGRKLDIHTINGEPAVNSPYLNALDDAFDLVRDYKSVYVQRQI